MKKKLNIILGIISVFSLSVFIYCLAKLSYLIKYWITYLEAYSTNPNNTFDAISKSYLNLFVSPYIVLTLTSLLFLIFSIIFFVYLNKLDLEDLKNTVFMPKLKEMQEKRKADKQSKEEEKRQQKIEELQKQIDELNKTDERP